MLRLPVFGLFCLAIVGFAIACGGDDSTETPSDNESAAAAVVQIIARDSFGDEVWRGSGTFIDPTGLILTNEHVVEDRDEYADLAIAVTTRTDTPPELSYLAEIVVVDRNLDLAVIAIVSNLDGETVDEQFPIVPIGDSDSLGIGDNLRIIGYPGIGGDSITLTEGVTSGFVTERGIEGRAWIKTDTALLAGNSGGLALHDGLLIGVPTSVGVGVETDEVVDCDLLADTNRDGVIDEEDACVSNGGFLNSLRPINLALPLIEAAQTGTEYVSAYGTADVPSEGFDSSDVFFDTLRFSDGVEGDDPTNVVLALPSGSPEVCVFWDYEGMANGMTWEAVWFIDGVIDDKHSFSDEWDGGESGRDWWICNVNEDGLQDGLYEVVFSVEDEFISSNTLFLGGQHPSVELTITNGTNVVICYLYFTPTQAQNWGVDRLDLEVLGVGEAQPFEIAAGTYDLSFDDCDGELVTEEYELPITSDTAYVIG